MPIPDYQTLMRPLLAYYADGQERRVSTVRDSLARDFALTASDLEERIPSGRAKTFHNRVGWATTYLYRTGLLERPARSVYRITPRGKQVLEANPNRIDLGVLDEFPEFREFRDARKEVATPIRPLESPGPPIGASTPEETMDAAYAARREALNLSFSTGSAVRPLSSSSGLSWTSFSRWAMAAVAPKLRDDSAVRGTRGSTGSSGKIALVSTSYMSRRSGGKTT